MQSKERNDTKQALSSYGSAYAKADMEKGFWIVATLVATAVPVALGGRPCQIKRKVVLVFPILNNNYDILLLTLTHPR